MAKVSGLAVAETAAGFVLLWSGLKNVPLRQTITSLAAGHAPAAAPTGPLTLQVGSGATGPGTLASSLPPALNQYTGGGSAAQNRTLGKFMATSYGWGSGTNWQALDYGWGTLESGWSNTAQNASSGAYGIPQADPYTKMPKSAWPPADGGSASAVTQIAWGLAYIKAAYGAPENVPGWLGQGGYKGY